MMELADDPRLASSCSAARPTSSASSSDGNDSGTELMTFHSPPPSDTEAPGEDSYDGGKSASLSTTLLALVLATALGPTSTDLYAPCLPAIAADLGVSIADAQATIAWYLTGYGTLQVVAGPVADRFGHARVLCAGLLMYVVISAPLAFASRVAIIDVLRLLQGCAVAFPVVSAQALVQTVFPARAERARVSDVLLAACWLPSSAPCSKASQAGAPCLRRWPALVSSNCARALPCTPRTRNDWRRQQRAAAHGGLVMATRSLAADWPSCLLVVIEALSYCAQNALVITASFVLQGTIYDLSTWEFGLAYAFMAIGYLSGTESSAHLAHGSPLGERGVLSLGLALSLCAATAAAAACAAASDATRAAWTFVATAGTLSFGRGLVAPMVVTILSERHPAIPGTVVGVTFSLRVLTLVMVVSAIGTAYGRLAIEGGLESNDVPAWPLSVAVLGLELLCATAGVPLIRPFRVWGVVGGVTSLMMARNTDGGSIAPRAQQYSSRILRIRHRVARRLVSITQ